MTIHEMVLLRENIRRDMENQYTKEEQETIISALDLLIEATILINHS